MKAACAAALWIALASSVIAQSPTIEIDANAGYSSEGVGSAAVQLRSFGSLRDDLSYYLEAAWGDREYAETDAFGAAYPYDHRLSLIEAYAEKRFSSRRYVSGLRVGQFRPPFGISSESDYAYGGFLRPPLIRYDGDYALSNFWLDAGVDAFFGTPRLLFEASAGNPQERSENRENGVSSVMRVQGYQGDWIVGASSLDSPRSRTSPIDGGRSQFKGLDARWMDKGVQVRGEWISGHPFQGVKTKGWHADLLVHKPFMENITAIARVEGIDYEAGIYSFHRERYTIGAKDDLSRSWIAEINAIHQTGFSTRQDVVIDAGLTYAFRR